MNEFNIERILAPTDLSKPSLIALGYARYFAQRFSAALSLLYVDPILFPVNGIGVDLPVYTAATPEHFSELEKEIRAYADDTLRGLPYQVSAVSGTPIPMIVREARRRIRSDPMATHGLRGWRHALLGSVTEGVLHAGDTPVFSVSRPEDRPRTTPAITKILCPINFTDIARESATYAANLAAALRSELVFVHVVDETDIRHATTGEAEVRGWIDPSIRVQGKYREIVLHGGAAERVLDCAEDIGADLLILGAQHKMFRDETVVGTTTERIVRFARMPVLTIPRAVERAVKHGAACHCGTRVRNCRLEAGVPECEAGAPLASCGPTYLEVALRAAAPAASAE